MAAAGLGMGWVEGAGTALWWWLAVGSLLGLLVVMSLLWFRERRRPRVCTRGWRRWAEQCLAGSSRRNGAAARSGGGCTASATPSPRADRRRERRRWTTSVESSTRRTWSACGGGWAARAERSRLQWEGGLMLPDGRVRWVSASARPVWRAAGRHWQGVAMDVTRVRRLEAGLSRVDRLMTLGTHAAQIGHELRHPLTVTLTSLACAEELAAPAGPLRDSIRDAREGAEAIREMAEGLRCMSRIHEGRENTRLADVLRASVSATEVVRPRGARIELDLVGSERVELAGTHVQLTQVFTKLLVNARDACRSVEGARIYIEVSEHRDCIHVAVRARGWASPRRMRSASSSPSTPPSRIGRAPGWGCRSALTWSRIWVGASACVARSVGAPPRWCSCQVRGAAICGRGSWRARRPRCPAGGCTHPPGRSLPFRARRGVRNERRAPIGAP